MSNSIYTTPPVWFTRSKHNKDATLKLTKAGWIAVFPDGSTEVVVAMKNVPAQYLNGETKPVKKVEPVAPVVELPKEEPVQETVVEETMPVQETVEEEAPVAEEQPKKKGRSKKTTTEE